MASVYYGLRSQNTSVTWVIPGHQGGLLPLAAGQKPCGKCPVVRKKLGDEGWVQPIQGSRIAEYYERAAKTLARLRASSATARSRIYLRVAIFRADAKYRD